MGLTFKQDVPDIRNSKVPDILAELREYGIAALVSDPLADPAAAAREYGIALNPAEALVELDALVLAVNHASYLADPADLITRVRKGGVLMDVKSALDRATLPEEFVYWSL
jgi:UDP-N-acetyl-D-galactosamine dehydrogenase